MRSPTTATIGAWIASIRERVVIKDTKARAKYYSCLTLGGFMIRRPRLVALALACLCTYVVTAAGTLQTPEHFFGHRVGADNRLIRWDKIVEYMKLAAADS